MTFPRWLDRLWLSLIAGSFLLMAPIWIILWYERNPWFGLAQAILVGTIAWIEIVRPLREAMQEDPTDSRATPFRTGMSCGCHGLHRCERHQLMERELAHRYGSRRSSTAFENASNPSSSTTAGKYGPR